MIEMMQRPQCIASAGDMPASGELDAGGHPGGMRIQVRKRTNGVVVVVAPALRRPRRNNSEGRSVRPVS